MFVFPKQLKTFGALTSLNISKNKLKEIPKSIGDMWALRSLFIVSLDKFKLFNNLKKHFGNNLLETLPDEIFLVSTMTYLFCTSRQRKNSL